MGHTPGPWRVNAHDICAGSDAVAGVYGTTGYAPEEAQANARLIAAAPDLLAALRLYVRLDDDRRAGCQITADDWAECHQAASAAIERNS